MSDETTMEMLAEIDRDLVEIETAVAELAREALQANYPQQIDTTTEMLTEIEGQADGITPDEVAAQQLIRGLVLQVAAAIEQQETVEQPQPVQVREGRWRTRGGQEIPVTAMPTDHDDFSPEYPWWHADMTWRNDGRFSVHENAMDLVEYLGPFEQPDKVITPDDVAAEALAGAINEWPSVQIVRREVEELQGELGRAQRRVVELETLVADLRIINEAQEKTVSAAGQRNTDLLKLLDNKKRRISELETLVVDLRVSNEATEKAVEAAGRQNVDLQHRLDVVSDEWLEQAATCNGLQQQLEAVKAELVQQTETSRRLQIELDAAQQVPQAVSDRFEEGWDAGTARAVETIVEWTEPFRACGSERLAWQVMANLPHIMRTLTGLTPED